MWVNVQADTGNTFGAMDKRQASQEVGYTWYLPVDSTNISTFSLCNVTCSSTRLSETGYLSGLGTFHHFAVTFDSVTSTFYKNGSQFSTTSPQAANAAAGTHRLSLGIDFGNFAGSGGEVIMDEVRISDVARSADWLAIEYANQFSTSTFYTIGAQEVFTPPDLGGSKATTRIRAGTVRLRAGTMIIR